MSFPHDQPKYWAMVYPEDNATSSAAPNVAAKNPTSITATPTLPTATATGSPAWPRWSTWIPRGCNTTPAIAINAIVSAPPRGNPTPTFIRASIRSLRDQPSSTAPEEKKNTSYGVIAAPNSAIAEYHHVGCPPAVGTVA